MRPDVAADRLDLVVTAIRPSHQMRLAIPLVDEELLLVGPRSLALNALHLAVRRGAPANPAGRRRRRIYVMA
ncbi:hypothetical protein [Streptomyces sp. Ru62]|uniref:hypothetical protein n=1 Tax=Streptomyces sp. Ru62 TaxID=2080745 RepID=UPI0015E37A18|nr:hypothetical protein [Streptomyces sp. Ru62]